jgi:pyridoxine 5-phosphate synthase
MATLGVNIDHVATLRQVRGTHYPEPVAAAAIAELAGADGITVHLREDRRHIQERDVRLLRETVETRLNLEMACWDDIVRIACEVGPDQATLVPERREELTTEGGLNVAGPERERVRATVGRLTEAGIVVSLFIEPDRTQIEAAVDVEAPVIEIHTGRYAEARGPEESRIEYERIRTSTAQALQMGLAVNAGHGLHYKNTASIAALPQMGELNIGHSIIARAVLTGLEVAVREMAEIIQIASGESGEG